MNSEKINITESTYRLLHEFFRTPGYEKAARSFETYFAPESPPPIHEESLFIEGWIDWRKTGESVRKIILEQSAASDEKKVLQLCGKNSSGKTTVGLALAVLLGYDFDRYSEFIKVDNIERAKDMAAELACEISISNGREKLAVRRVVKNGMPEGRISYSFSDGVDLVEHEVPFDSLLDYSRGRNYRNLSTNIRKLLSRYIDFDFIDSDRDVVKNVATISRLALMGDIDKINRKIKSEMSSLGEKKAQFRTATASSERISSLRNELSLLKNTKEELKERGVELESDQKRFRATIGKTIPKMEKLRDAVVSLLSEYHQSTLFHYLHGSENPFDQTSQIKEQLAQERRNVLSHIDSGKALVNEIPKLDPVVKKLGEYVRALGGAEKVAGGVGELTRLDEEFSHFRPTSWDEFVKENKAEIDSLGIKEPKGPKGLKATIDERYSALKDQQLTKQRAIESCRNQLKAAQLDIEKQEGELPKHIELVKEFTGRWSLVPDSEPFREKLEEFQSATSEWETLDRGCSDVKTVLETFNVLSEKRLCRYSSPEDFVEMIINDRSVDAYTAKLISGLNDTQTLMPISLLVNKLALEFVSKITDIGDEGVAYVADIAELDLLGERVVYETPDRKKRTLRFSELGRGQKSVLSILSTAGQPSFSRMGRLLVVDEIGDLDRSDEGFYPLLTRLLQYDSPNTLGTIFIFPSDDPTPTLK